jgi:hypothetical protein
VIGGNLVKILAWYDNEWGFSNRLVDLAKKWHNADCNNTRQNETTLRRGFSSYRAIRT